jgi:hypothetical protein
LLALLGARHILHVSRVRVKMLHGQAVQIVLLALFDPEDEGKIILRNFGNLSSDTK